MSTEIKAVLEPSFNSKLYKISYLQSNLDRKIYL